MKVSDSQLSYLKSRNKDYDLKYGAIERILIENAKKFYNRDVIELFGGVGITSYYIQSLIKPKSHTILEIDNKCIEILKNNIKSASVLEIDAFSFKNYKKNDIVFIDSSSFTRKYDKAFSVIFNSMAESSDIIFTETEIYKLFYKKDKHKDMYKEHYDELNEYFRSYNLNLISVYYYYKYSILHIKKSKRERKSYSLIENKFQSFDWRDYRKRIENKKLFFLGEIKNELR